MQTRISTKALFAWLIVAGLASGPAHAYHLDSHYLLRFTLSLTTCFNWEESHLIASGDWGMDENSNTHAEMNPVQKFNKINWHAFGHSDKRFKELWLRSVSEEDLDLRLVKLGQFMHFLEDWEAHAGYGTRLGHARDTYRGRDPDSLGNSMAKNHRMVQSALDHLLATCEDLGRLKGDRDRQLIEIMQSLYDDHLLQDLYEESEPGWKKGKMGGMRPEGERILQANKTRLEQFIQSHLESNAELNIPETFEPGGSNGIPPSLRFRFDQQGNFADTRTDLEKLRETATAEKHADVSVSVDEARLVHRRLGPNRSSGWQIQITAVNLGESSSEPGSIEVVVVDSEEENIVVQSSESLPALQPGESRQVQVSLYPTKHPESDVIIGAYAKTGDLSASNDEDWLMLGDAEEEQPEVPVTTDLDPQPAGPVSIEFLSPPKFFVIDTRACIMVEALVSGGDSTEKLDTGAVELAGGIWDDYTFQQTIPSRWSAIPTESGLVGGKTFACFVPKQEAVDLIRGMDVKNLEVTFTLEADNFEPQTRVFPMDEQFYRDMLRIQE